MTRYDLFRRRIAPVAFALAIVLIARDTCNKQDRTHATIVLDYGAAAPKIGEVHAVLWSEGVALARFDRPLGAHMGRSTFPILMTSQDGELRFDVELGAEHRKFTRRFHADDDATVTIPLESDLR